MAILASGSWSNRVFKWSQVYLYNVIENLVQNDFNHTETSWLHVLLNLKLKHPDEPNQEQLAD